GSGAFGEKLRRGASFGALRSLRGRCLGGGFGWGLGCRFGRCSRAVDLGGRGFFALCLARSQVNARWLRSSRWISRFGIRRALRRRRRIGLPLCVVRILGSAARTPQTRNEGDDQREGERQPPATDAQVELVSADSPVSLLRRD